MASYTKEVSERISKVNRSFKTSLNNRLDRMSFKDTDGTTYDSETGNHDTKNVYFVQRDANTIELWKGDTKISGSGGGGIRVNNCLITLDNSGFVSGEVSSDTSLNSASYPNANGIVSLKTTGVYSNGTWTKQNAPSSSGVCLNNNQYVGWGRMAEKKYPIFTLDIVRPLSGVLETLYFYDCQTSVSQRRTYDKTSVYQNRTIGSFTGSTYDWPTTLPIDAKELASWYSDIYIERYSNGILLSSGWYSSNGLTPYEAPNAMISLRFTDIVWDQTYGAVSRTGHSLWHGYDRCDEYPKSSGHCRQLGLLYDFGSSTALEAPWIRFDTANVTPTDNNEYKEYLLIKGECS